MKNANTRFIVGAAAAVCLLVIGLGCPAKVQQEKKEIKIGVILPLTGEGALWGNNSQKGIDLAVEQVNQTSSVGFKVSVEYEDSRTDAKAAVAALQKLITQYGIQCAIVDMVSSNVLAMAPIANAEKVVIISPGASSPAITDAGPYVFRNWPSDALQGVVNAQFAMSELKWKRAGIVYVLNAYGEGLKDAFQQEFEKRGGKIVVVEGVKQGASDARSQIAKVNEVHQSSGLDGIYLAIYPTEHPVVLRQLSEMKLKLPLLATETFDDPAIHRLKVAEGVIFSVPAPAGPSSKVASNFRKAFKEKYGKEPGLTADAAYDALNMLVMCIKEVGNSGPKIRKYLGGVKDYDGAAGLTTFDKNGDCIKPFALKTVKDGKVVNFTDRFFVPKEQQ